MSAKTLVLSSGIKVRSVALGVPGWWLTIDSVAPLVITNPRGEVLDITEYGLRWSYEQGELEVSVSA